MAVDIVARLRLRAEEFSRATRTAFAEVPAQAEQAGRDTGARFGKGFSVGLGDLVGTATIAAIGALGTRALESMTALRQYSAELVISTKDLQEYRYAAGQVGVAQEDFNAGLEVLADRVGAARAGNKDAAASFKALGVDVTGAQGKIASTGAVLSDVIRHLSGIEDPAKRARMEAGLFGDTWRRIDPLLSAGSATVDNLRVAARDLGIVLSDQQIQDADKTARKLEQVKAVLEADIASTVANNAQAITGMANSLLQLSGGLAKWWSQNPEKAYALIGAAAGLSLGGGVGAVVGGVAGGLYGSFKRDEMNDANPDLKFRAQQLRAAQAEYKRLRDGPAQGTPSSWSTMGGLVNFRRTGEDDGGLLSFRRSGGKSFATATEAKAEWQRQLKLFQSAQASAVATSDVNAPALFNYGEKPEKAKGKTKEQLEAERDAKKLADEYQRLSDNVAKTVTSQEDAARVERIRVELGDRAAEKAEVLARLAQQYAELQGATVKTLTDKYHVNEQQAQALLDQYDTAKKLATADVDRKFDEQDAKARVEAEKKAQEEIDRLREQAAAEQRRQMEDVATFYADLFRGRTGDIWKDFKRQGLETISVLAAQFTIALLSGKKLDLSSALGAAGQMTGSPLGSLLGSIAGGLGNSGGIFGGASAASVASKGLASLAPGLGSASSIPLSAGSIAQASAGAGASALGGIGGALASAAPYLAIASFALPALSGLLGGIFGKTKKGSATLAVSDGQFGVGTVSGNSSSRKQAASGSLSSVADALNMIADELGGDILGAGSVSIGVRKKSYRVDTTGSGRTKGSGVVDFGSDQEAAIRYAISDALQDGVIGGISDASKRILASGQKLETAIEKAASIEAIGKTLKARLDPLGAALDEIDDKFTTLAATLKEGGASAEQISQARELWQLERADAIEQIGEASKSLKDYLASLKAGPDSPLSLRDQEKAASAALQPFVDKINAGQSIDQDAFQEAANTFLSVERQMNGGTQAYFDQFDRIMTLTAQAIKLIDDNATTTTAATDPFAQLTAQNTQATNTILEQTNSLLSGIAKILNVGQAIPAGYVVDGRYFVKKG